MAKVHRPVSRSFYKLSKIQIDTHHAQCGLDLDIQIDKMNETIKNVALERALTSDIIGSTFEGRSIIAFTARG